MKSTILLLFLTACFPFYFYGQSRSLEILVRDSLTGQAVSYVSVWAVKNGTYADGNEFGKATILIASNDTLQFSRVGYFSKWVCTNAVSNVLEILLSPRVDTLTSVVVKPLGENWMYSNFKNKSCRTINFSNDSVLSQVAVKIALPAGAKGIRLNSIKFRQRAFAENFLRLHVYRMDEHGLPGDELLTEVVILNATHFKKGVLNIPIDPMNAYIEESSFFVALQWLTQREPISIGRKNDIGIAETCSLEEATTYYQNFGNKGGWYQSLSNGIRVYNKYTGQMVERKIYRDQPIGKADNLMIEVGGRLF